MISRVVTEINLNWAEQHPALFAAAVVEFQQKYNNCDWKISVDLSRNRYMSLTATRHFNNA